MAARPVPGWMPVGSRIGTAVADGQMQACLETENGAHKNKQNRNIRLGKVAEHAECEWNGKDLVYGNVLV